MEVKVSVIIPVYNAEKYIQECIQSLLNQTLVECEFIFIDDGSNDNSRNILEYYKKLDNRILLINQENQGVSVARNKGLEVAQGEFIGFVDADDHIREDMYEILYSAANKWNCDSIISNFESIVQGRQNISKFPILINQKLNREYIWNNVMPIFLMSDELNAIWNKIFRRKIIHENGIRFPEKISLGEDGIFNIRFFLNTDSLLYVDYSGYFYREVQGSATKNILEKDYFQRALEEYNTIFQEFNNIKTLSDLKISKFRAIKLVRKVMSYTHFYFEPTSEMSFVNRYKYVNNMLHNIKFREALKVFFTLDLNSKLGRYEKVLLAMMDKKLTIGLYLITTYSRIRNK